MMKLPVAALGSSDTPAILLKALDDVANLHTGHRPLARYPLPFFNCCFHPSTRALFPSASASGTIPFF